MKQLFLVVLLSFTMWPIVVLGYPGMGILGKIESQSPDIWGVAVNDIYVPRRGGIKVCKEQNQIIVGFYLSQENIDFYNQEFSNGVRKPLGFEMLITDYSGVFHRDNMITYYTSFPHANVRYDENYFTDLDSAHTLAISNPTQLNKNQWHTVTFQFSEHVDVSLARFAVQVQLVGDLYGVERGFWYILRSVYF